MALSPAPDYPNEMPPNWTWEASMAKIQEVPATDFIADLDRWSVAAQSSPVMVTDAVSGVALGYLLSPSDFDNFRRLRALARQSRFAWEMPADMAELLRVDVVSGRQQLDDLMGD